MNATHPVTWVFEPDVFQSGHEELLAAAIEAGHSAVVWNDDWWASGKWPRLDGQAVIFRGSLENAARVRRQLPWRPGAFCDVVEFCCSTWYPRASQWLLNQPWRVIAADNLASDPAAAVAGLGSPESVFVRPDSPLKPFSGRVLPVSEVTLERLDHGFYFDDPQLPVIVAAVRRVENEWRFVVVNDQVVAGSEYSAEGRKGAGCVQSGSAWEFAADVGSKLARPEAVYVMDICRCDGRLWLLELNPFSGADLYDCSATAVVRGVSSAAASFLPA